ncbi:hypothetical protein PVAND_012210 [Polypedilum vanderplanki]|uniref:Uncharacterized protein n=1 Tax=Polypedilum vanderplanki TaxID=319348 RepID=A0A9J6CLQ7_POLVA|nr:hypothetical protein PVAND_012210 [Polypedilum vanderplanki]
MKSAIIFFGFLTLVAVNAQNQESSEFLKKEAFTKESQSFIDEIFAKLKPANFHELLLLTSIIIEIIGVIFGILYLMKKCCKMCGCSNSSTA